MLNLKRSPAKKKTNKETENMGEQSTFADWDVDDYRTEYESDEHWELRRSFMEAYKSRFDEQQLVCLAQTFVNMEFLGCKYPSETMHLVAELSKDIAEDFRSRREQRLKRTFVSASDAAEQRAKGRKNTSSNRDAITADQPLATINQKLSSFGIGEPINLFQDLRFGKLIIQLAGGRNCLRNSCSLIKAKYDERQAKPDPNKANGTTIFEILINDEIVAAGSGDSVKTGKLEAFKQALIVLQSLCYSYKVSTR
ncbi:CDKN2A-interacting protein isoform X2 [Drosophila tropicalis]|uniref:CDKN2A-interacting protein isoform X2 n=1 Tax=Drosophila tropicalis TaxID=46794 RepID=UPI0035ABA612